MTSQKFGGLWSLLKLKILGDYLTAYCTALSGKFHILYIDAFAGSGEFSIREFSAAPLFDEEESIRVVEGSARLALDCTPSFDHLYFIEMKRRNVQALEALASEYTSQKIDVLRGDANEKVIDICKGTNWKNTRGVIFLDPYGNSVEWETLARISQTKALDVWYLFPLFGVYRQAPNSLSKMTDDKRQSITKILGTDE
ncbi:MAG: three-Cys-motif partner protein TcmP, partial [Parvibaculum sp.]|nr:three-Cys-motif partner protein TcmP [Parvibaculum sp.]